ncbi:MAG TPA: DUF805 domain-containing protein [Methylibium sp.]
MTTPAPNRFDEPLSPAQILFSFQGRIPRKIFWLYGVLGSLLFALFLGLVLGIAGFEDYTIDAIINLLLIWPGLAIMVKRWHDRDKSGWWVLINLIPVIGFVWTLVEGGFLRGSNGPNRYGEDLTGRV